MQIRQLQFVITLARAGTISHAAERESVSLSVFRSQIERLEAELGVQLFKHRESEVELTPAGVIFVKRVRSILNECAILTGGLRRSAGSNPHGPPSAPLEGAYTRRGGSEDATVLATISQGIVRDPRFVLVVSSQHPLAERDTVSLASLEDESLVEVSNCERLSEAKQLLRERGIRPKVVYETQDYDRALDLIRAQAGIAIFPPLRGSVGVAQIPFSDIEFSNFHKLQ